jgi:arylsulfatase A-like enzyme
MFRKRPVRYGEPFMSLKRFFSFAAAFALFVLCLPISALASPNPDRHVLVVVWDGMRPDFVTPEYCPVLWSLVTNGVFFTHHHSVYPSATEVNGTAISTGMLPAHGGVIGNHVYRPEIDPLHVVRAEGPDVVKKGDELTHGRYIRSQTMAEIVRAAGGRTAVAGSKPVALLPDRRPRQTADQGANIYSGDTLPAGLKTMLVSKYGEYPPDTNASPSRIDWTTDAVIDPLWAKEIPDFTFVWMNQPDLVQHLTGPGSAQTLVGIRNSDDNLGKLLKVLQVRSELSKTDIIVVSDHGCSTVSQQVDTAAYLKSQGINAARTYKTKPKKGDVVLASNSGSLLVYVIEHDAKTVEKVVDAFQKSDFAGVIFSQKQLPGTFSLATVNMDSPEAPDVVVSMTWTSDKSVKTGAPGMLYADSAAFGPGQGSHVSLSAWDMHATLVASGPHFRKGIKSDLASGNVDVAPTVLKLLGYAQPRTMDGRVLREALNTIDANGLTGNPSSKTIEASSNKSGVAWKQYLKTVTVGNVTYFDEGNRLP